MWCAMRRNFIFDVPVAPGKLIEHKIHQKYANGISVLGER